MNETERSLDASSEPALTELQGEVQSLKRLVSVVIALLIMVTFSVDVYLMRQVTTVNRELAGAQNVVDDFTKRVAPVAGEFWNKLNEYGRSHPDFAPVLARYSNFVHITPVPATAPKKN